VLAHNLSPSRTSNSTPNPPPTPQPPGLSDTSSKVQISAANMLNQLLSTPELVARARVALAADDRAVVSAVMGLLDHALPLLRAKGILAVVLLCRWVFVCGRVCVRGREGV